MFARTSLKLGAAVLLVAAALAVTSARGQADDDWNFSGDFRLRYERTNNQSPGPLLDSRSREVVRFRGGVKKAINDRVELGVRLTTGDQGDPNTADVTLGSFVDDLNVSFDRAYLAWKKDGLMLSGGKFANPFRVTDLVWDGDVNPQGVAASYAFPGNGRVKGKVAGLFYIVDENSSSTTPDSDMRGGQAEVTMTSGGVGVTFAGGYYDYKIESLIHADAGDTRSNNLNAAGTAYLSDFDLLDFIAVVDMPGFHERYPLHIVGDFVKNLGAEVDEDQGFSIDVFAGRASKVKDARVGYGYSQAETDAVLAAFSNDNTTIATNYKQHTFTIDYVPIDHTTLNLICYIFRKDVNPVGDPDDWITRVRLNAVVKF